MSAFDLVYAFKNIEIPNAAGSLLNVDAAVIDNTTWKDGFTWAQGDQSIAVKGRGNAPGLRDSWRLTAASLLAGFRRGPMA